jgi:hypothetical protein
LLLRFYCSFQRVYRRGMVYALLSWCPVDLDLRIILGFLHVHPFYLRLVQKVWLVDSIVRTSEFVTTIIHRTSHDHSSTILITRSKPNRNQHVTERKNWIGRECGLFYSLVLRICCPPAWLG